MPLRGTVRRSLPDCLPYSFGETVLQLPLQIIVGTVADAQNIGTISLQTVAEQPVGLGEVGEYKYKLYKYTLRLRFHITKSFDHVISPMII